MLSNYPSISSGTWPIRFFLLNGVNLGTLHVARQLFHLGI